MESGETVVALLGTGGMPAELFAGALTISAFCEAKEVVPEAVPVPVGACVDTGSSSMEGGGRYSRSRWSWETCAGDFFRK